MSDNLGFVPFSKIARLSREIIVTEKIDGTNAQILIGNPGLIPDEGGQAIAQIETEHGPVSVFAGSRSRWLQPTKGADNFGFAAWVRDNLEELAKLGPGRHYGEWWGLGIQSGYAQTRKRFSLFNVERWADERPACCDVVPLMYRGEFDINEIDGCLARLAEHGSLAAPGFMKPEGVIVFHTASRQLFKKTIHKDSEPKSAAA
jgi:hypothetical protein